MKKVLILTAMTLLPLWGAGSFLYAQSSVNVTLLNAAPGAPASLTFSVEWADGSRSAIHRDTVWVFADFQPIDANGNAGAWKAATFAALPSVIDGAGTPVPESFNGRGFYLAGSPSGAFASTLTATLTEPVNTKFNACLYVSDYPPNATMNTGGGYSLHGTPPFIINNTIRETTRTFAAGTCITSLTDSTGCPGFVNNGPALVTGSIATRGDTVCVGGAPKMISGVMPVSGGDGSVIYSWYKDGVPISGATDANYTPPLADAAVPGTHTYTRTVHDQTCNITPRLSDGSWVLRVSEVPTVTLAAPASSVCAGSAVTLTATAGAASYQFNGGSWQTANTATVTVNVNSTYTVKARSDLGCETASASSATVTVVYPAFSAGTITTASVSTTAGTAPTNNPANATAASGGDGSITYEWRRSGTSSKTLTSSNTSGYTINSDATNYNTAGTYYFTRYAKDGACHTTFTASDGTYTLTVAIPTPPSAGTKTYTCGTQTWSEPVKIAACAQSSFTNHYTTPYCRSYTYNGINYFYYNWAYVNANKGTMCPSPWHVPTITEFSALLSCLGNSTNGVYYPESSTWGGALAGSADWSTMYQVGSYGPYWSATVRDTDYAYFMYFMTNMVFTDYNYRGNGYQVRASVITNTRIFSIRIFTNG
jgi:uncharacterized protein (TIGR02145 family)